MTFETSFIFITSLILLWIKPGPGQAYRISLAFQHGFFPAFITGLGTTTTCLLFFVVAVLGISALTNFFNDIGFFLKIFGAIYLFYLGAKGLKSQYKPKSSNQPVANKASYIENYFAGFFLTLANPITIFYFVSILPTLVPVGTLSIQDFIQGMVIVFCVGTIVDILILTLSSQVRGVLTDTRFVRYVYIGTCISFILIGFYLLYTALFVGDRFSFSVI